MALTFRDTQGFDLSAAQVDENFRFLMTLIQDLIDNPPAAVGISNITVSGSQMTVFLEDATSFGPFTLPIAAFHWREDGWLPETGYFVGDFLPHEGSLYLVLQDHTSALTFDSGALNSDEPIYLLLWSTLTPSFSTVVNTSEVNLTPLAADAGTYYRAINPAGLTVFIGNGPFAVDSEFHFYQATTAPIVFLPANVNQTINPYDGYLNQTGGRGRVVTLKNVATNTWDIFGGLAIDDGEYNS